MFDTLAVSWAVTLCIHFSFSLFFLGGGLLPLTEFCQEQNSLCVQVLRYLVLLHGTRAVGVSQTLRRGIFTRQGGHPFRHWAVKRRTV